MLCGITCHLSRTGQSRAQADANKHRPGGFATAQAPDALRVRLLCPPPTRGAHRLVRLLFKRA